jgi:hypothetical protein
MKKKNGLLQTFFYDFLKIQVTNWVREILVTCENQLSIIYWFLLRYTVIIYKFTQGNLGAKKIASSRFQSPVKKKNRKLRHWRPTARSLSWSTQRKPKIFCYYWQTFMIVSCIDCTWPRARNWSWWQGWGRGTSYINVYTDMSLKWFDFFSFQIYDWVVNCPPLMGGDVWINVREYQRGNPEKLATYKTKKNLTKTQHNMCWTPLYANKYK